jgi:hydrophobe/amphiphile efflux-1 (HAE1) family protein
MNPSAIFINRPVLSSVVSILIVLFGVIGYLYLGVREFPSVDPPVVSVTTDYPGANADIIDAQVTEPLEASISGIAGIKNITSISSDGRSSITIEFDLSIDMDAAANDVRDKVAGAVRRLPPDVEPSIVSKADSDAQPIMAVLVQSNKRNLLELTQIGNDLFKERIQTIPGVSQVNIWGEKQYSMKLLLDPVKLAAYGLTPLDIRNALTRENVDLPSGVLEGRNAELTIRALGRLTTEEEFNDLIIKDNLDNPVRLRDVGVANLRPLNERAILRGNGAIPQIGVAVTPQPGTNYIDISDAFQEKLKQIDKELPDDIDYRISFDITDNIRAGIKEVRDTIMIAFGLVMLVIFLFLRRWRTTLIPVVTIPISLIGTFFIMYISNFSINILTLLGIVLATGLVVDDAIVVLENIYKKIEDGIPARQAALQGSQEIFFAVISTTVTLVAVFLPIIFLQGLTGRLFREFGVVVAGAVIISTIVSLTLTPMLCGQVLTRKDKHSGFYKWSERFFDKMESTYQSTLLQFMKVRWLAFVVMGLSIGLIYWIGRGIQSELAPMEDKGRLVIRATAPEGTSFENMDAFNISLMEMLDTLPERETLIGVTSPGFGSSVSINSSFVRFNMGPPNTRERSQFEIADWVTSQLKNFPMARTFVVQEQTIGGGRNSGLPVSFVIQATNFDKLKSVIPQFMESARNSDKFSVVDLDVKFNKPELTVEIDRNRATALGVSVQDVAQTLQLLFGGVRFGYFIFNGKQYQVIGQADRKNREKPLDLTTVNVRNNRGQLIPLDNVVTLTETSTPPQLYRYNRYVSATVSANPAPGVSLGQGIEEMERIADEVLDDTFSTDLAGISREFRESSNSLIFAFLLSLVLVYLVLAAQFESFRDPLIIMFTVPLAITGAIISLSIAGMTLNIFSQIGIIVLVGIVTKNGILIVEFANQIKDSGKDKINAVVEAATLRLRPILMTSLATILGAVPIAMALGSGSTSRTPMGTVIIGGLLFSLILTLYVIPAIYSYFTGRGKALKNIQNEPIT